jgi:tetratricopeptide (TPR) repeat protein
MRGHLELSQRAVEIADAVGDPDTLVDALVSRGYALSYSGQLEASVACTDRGLELEGRVRSGTSSLWGWNPILQLRVLRAQTVTFLGRLEEAEELLQEARHLAQALGEKEVALSAEQWLVENAEFQGHPEKALAHAQHVTPEKGLFEETFWAAQPHAYMARALLMANRLEEAIAEFDRWDELLRQHGLRRSTAVTVHLPYRAEAYSRNGDVERALACAREAIELADNGGLGVARVGAELTHARALLRMGDGQREEALKALDRSAEFASSTGARVYEPFIGETRAMYARRLGREQERTQHLQAAQRLFAELGAAGHAQRIANALA